MFDLICFFVVSSRRKASFAGDLVLDPPEESGVQVSNSGVQVSYSNTPGGHLNFASKLNWLNQKNSGETAT